MLTADLYPLPPLGASRADGSRKVFEEEHLALTPM